MDEVQKLEHLSLVSKICTELENHLGLNDKDLAEFIISLAEKNDNFEAFKKVLIDNGAEFSDSFIANLLRIIQHMRPKPLQAAVKELDKTDKLAVKFPGLALPNDGPYRLEDSKSLGSKKKKKKDKDKEDDVIDDAMAALEALAPSHIKSGITSEPKIKEEILSSPESSDSETKVEEVKVEKRIRSHSRERERGSRRDKERKRERSRSRSGSRSRKRDRHGRRDRRDRSNSRQRRSRSRDRKRRSRDRSRDKYKEKSRRRSRTPEEKKKKRKKGSSDEDS
ncbi:ATP-dependent RNA helicase dhx8 [Homalodisca vitripennis]|nr:ATP-dependent RNA helicase dhx8 [Homalodisca vitripennis]